MNAIGQNNHWHQPLNSFRRQPVHCELAAELRLYAIGHNLKLISNSFQFVEEILPEKRDATM